MTKPPSKTPPSKAASGKPRRQGGGATCPPWMPDTIQLGEDIIRPARGHAGKAGGSRSSATDQPRSSQLRPPRPTGAGAQRDPHAEREARRYERPIASREAILALLAAAAGPLTVEAIADSLALLEDDQRDALGKRLAAMLRDGQLLMNRRGGYALTQKLDLIAGSVIANPEGFGFMKPDAGGDDLFLPPHELRKAMHGDRVLASVTGIDRRGRREGAIVEVLERRLSRLLGRYEQRDGVGYVVPDDRRLLMDVMIPPDASLDARNGQIVVCEITAPPERQRPPFGKILSVLGDRLTPSLMVEAAIHGHNIPHEFPQAALDEAAKVPLTVDAKTAATRVDLRDMPLVTIDGEDAKDFDDAVYCEPQKDGFRLVVAIADVSSYVRPGTALDDEAQLRATSVYFPGFVVPMLPETLSNGICSLNPKVDRLCFVCDMRVGFDGVVTKSKFYEATMRSQARLTYTQVWNAVGAGVLDEARADARARIGALLPNVERLHQLYDILAKARARRGAIEFETSETRFVLDQSGQVIQAGMLERNDAHKLIEECMIAANVEAAKYLLAKHIPAPYRVHDRPPESKYADLQEFLAEFALRMPAWNQVQPRDFTALLKTIRGRPDAALLESVLLRSQSLAVYSPDNHGHFGLALEAYAHFTSPIRRYPDLLVHRAIKYALAGGKADGFEYTPHRMEQLSLQCSEKSRRADEASREVDERYRAAWMEEHVGSEFDGVISGVTSFGLFVELHESKVNGLVHVTQLPHDYYHFDPIRKLLSGERTGARYRLGEPVRVLVLRASVEDRKIDFRLVSAGGKAVERSTQAVGRPQPHAKSFGGGRGQAEPRAGTPRRAGADAKRSKPATTDRSKSKRPQSNKPGSNKSRADKPAASSAKSPRKPHRKGPGR